MLLLHVEWQTSVLPPLHMLTGMDISVDQYVALHQRYNSIQAALSTS